MSGTEPSQTSPPCHQGHSMSGGGRPECHIGGGRQNPAAPWATVSRQVLACHFFSCPWAGTGPPAQKLCRGWGTWRRRRNPLRLSQSSSPGVGQCCHGRTCSGGWRNGTSMLSRDCLQGRGGGHLAPPRRGGAL